MGRAYVNQVTNGEEKVAGGGFVVAGGKGWPRAGDRGPAIPSSGQAFAENAACARQPCDLPRLRCALLLAERLRAGSAAGSVVWVLANDCRSPLIASVSVPTCSESFLVSACCAANSRRTVCNWSCTTCNWSIDSCWVASRPLVFSTSCSDACAVRACNWRLAPTRSVSPPFPL